MPDIDIDFDYYSIEHLKAFVKNSKSIALTSTMVNRAQDARQAIEKAWPYQSGISDADLHAAKLYESSIRFKTEYENLLRQQSGGAQSACRFFAVGLTAAAVAATVAVYLNIP